MATSPSSLDYTHALEFLYGRLDYERTATVPYRLDTAHLARMRTLLHALGNPHQKLQTVHLAGTKGKGSTAAMIGSILTAAGIRTGLYTSPHLECLEERMSVDGIRCSAAELAGLVETVRPVVRELDLEAERRGWNSGPTFFEITTALAWLHFVQQNVQLVVLEVGMGGRLDSTNVCQPIVTVITSISYDHTRQLGNTLSSIAREKAGIIKAAIPVVSGVTAVEPGTVIRETARQLGCALIEVGRDFDFRYEPPETPRHMGTLDFEELAPARQLWQQLPLGLLGRHQAANAANALATIRCLESLGWQISDRAIRTGLAQVQCPARIEIVQQQPAIIIDTAHNVASVQALLEVLEQLFRDSRQVLVFAATRGKDVKGMLQLLLKHFEHVIITQYLDNPRGVPVHELAKQARQIGQQSRPGQLAEEWLTVCDTPADAWQVGRQLVGNDDLLCITGSFFLAAEVRRLIPVPGSGSHEQRSKTQQPQDIPETAGTSLPG